MTDTRYMSKEFITDLINLYRSHPCLWQTRSKEYTNKNLKHKAYNELVQYTKKTVPDANREFVTKKIQNLRASFRKEMKKVEASKRSGASADDIYEPTLWYYDLLLFTLDSETALESIDNITEYEEPQTNAEAEINAIGEEINEENDSQVVENETQEAETVNDRQVMLN